MVKIITKQTKSGLSYSAFDKPDEIKVSHIGKTVIVAGQKELFMVYKVHPEGSFGFKTGGVECVIGVSGIAKHCFFLDQVKLYNGRDLTPISKPIKNHKKKVN